MKVDFGDLKREYLDIKEEIDSAILNVLNSGWFVLGKQVENFEKEFANYIGTKYSVSCASGTDALALSLMALDIGPGDEVITTDMTAVPTISAISMVGAVPILVDTLEDSCLIDPRLIEGRITSKTKAIIPVHLYGQLCEMAKIKQISKRFNIPIIEDACQAHGATYKNKKAGSIGILGCFSFYPSKNLGCYGDGGAITTNSGQLYKKLVMIRNYGQSKRYYHDIVGINSRLDEIQAAILRVKLLRLDSWNKRRHEIANKYSKGIKNKKIEQITSDPKTISNHHLYVIKTKRRDHLMNYMAENGIQTMIHYPVNIHRQKAYRSLGYNKNDFPVSLKSAGEIVSLPMHPYLTEKEIEYIISTINQYK